MSDPTPTPPSPIVPTFDTSSPQTFAAGQLKQLWQWMVDSALFRRWSGTVGGVAVGMWISFTYWHQILLTLAAWGITPGGFKAGLVAAIGASGIFLSQRLSVVKTKQDAVDVAPQAEAKVTL